MSYIDTKYLFKCETCSSYTEGKCYIYCDHGESYYPDMTKIPTADVVEVVRCKNCKHWHKCLSDDGSVEYIHFSRCTKGNQLANGNDYFCGSGERNID